LQTRRYGLTIKVPPAPPSTDRKIATATARGRPGQSAELL